MNSPQNDILARQAEDMVCEVQLTNDDFSKEKSYLDDLMHDSAMFRHGTEYKELLDFVGRMKDMAPFNAMLLRLQKPGVRYVATKKDWWTRYARRIQEDARPLLIMRPFGPVSLVYDLESTEGKPVTRLAQPFRAEGSMTEANLARLFEKVEKKKIRVKEIDVGSSLAGSINRLNRPIDPKEFTNYIVRLNQSHDPALKFSTFAHELAHLFLGHLGTDTALGITGRANLMYEQRELEAESVAYLLCRRLDIEPNSSQYLSNFFRDGKTDCDFDVYEIIQVTNRIEKFLKLHKFSLCYRDVPVDEGGSFSVAPAMETRPETISSPTQTNNKKKELAFFAFGFVIASALFSFSNSFL